MKELVLAAVLSFARGPIAQETAHLEAIADDITSVVSAEDAPLAFDGPAAREATAVLLVAIAAHESGFSHEVDDCRKRGDGGRSRTMWQLMGTQYLGGHSTAEVCAKRRLAARLALELIGATWARSQFATPQELINMYAAGEWRRASQAAREICAMWQSRAERLGLIGASCGRRWPITRRRTDTNPAPASSRSAGRSRRDNAPRETALLSRPCTFMLTRRGVSRSRVFAQRSRAAG